MSYRKPLGSTCPSYDLLFWTKNISFLGNWHPYVWQDNTIFRGTSSCYFVHRCKPSVTQYYRQCICSQTQITFILISTFFSKTATLKPDFEHLIFFFFFLRESQMTIKQKISLFFRQLSSSDCLTYQNEKKKVISVSNLAKSQFLLLNHNFFTLFFKFESCGVTGNDKMSQFLCSQPWHLRAGLYDRMGWSNAEAKIDERKHLLSADLTKMISAWQLHEI